MNSNIPLPVWRQSYQKAIASIRLQQQLVQIKKAIELLDIVIVSDVGQLQFVTKSARKLLNKYFPASPLDINCLPENLQTWVNEQIAVLHEDREIQPNCLPLCIEQQGKKLTIRMIGNGKREEYLLFLEEQQLFSLSALKIQSLGLTKREAEVMFWVIQGKSNMEIGEVLGCSDRTIKKHLEHIYTKLGVQTRSNAITCVLGKLCS